MHIDYSTPERAFFPIVFPSEHTLATSVLFKIFYSLECLITIVATPALVKFCRAIDISAIFHRNLILITKFQYCVLYMALPSRIILILYAMEIITVPDNNRFTPIFLVSCFANIFGKGVSTVALPSMLLERLVASHYISDYEAKSRIWVAACVVACSCALSSLFSWAMVFGVLGVDKVIFFVVGICIVSSVTYVSLYRRERQRLKNFIIGPQTRHYLSTKFQLIENLRVLKAIMFATLIYSVWALLPSMLLVMVFFHFLPSTYTGQLLYEFFELFMSLSIAGLYMYSVIALEQRAGRRLILNHSLLKDGPHKENQDDRHITEAYFNNLKSAWA